MAEPGWQLWVDRGGTFTDVVGWRPGFPLVTCKLLSVDPARYRDAAVEGIRRVVGVAAGEAVTPTLVRGVKMGTTVATNALLERRGEPTVLVATEGFGDALRIGYQERPRVFAREIVLPEVLYARVVEARERVGAGGEVVQPLDEDALRAELAHALSLGLRSVAIVFMHGFAFPDHERRAATLARDVGFEQVCASHEVSPLMKLVSRGDTTVVDAYLSPILRRYVDELARDLPGVPISFMQSSGGLAHASGFRGKDAIFSGPAGGVVGMARTAERAGYRRVIGFDMGGTSTDVSHYAGEFERTFDTKVAGVRVRAPMMHVHTIAAGGGSVLRFDGARLRVGPQSAGSDPGPACYRRGGPLTLTDANVLLGRIHADGFPRVFGGHGDEGIDTAVVQQRFALLAAGIGRDTGVPSSPEVVAEGFVDIAVDAMANAIKTISVARGHDVRDAVLQCFGGAAGQHACRVADALGVATVLVHPLAGVLSAYGMGLADRTAMASAAVEQPLSGATARVEQRLGALERDARSELGPPAAGEAEVRAERRVHVRYDGSDTALVVPWGGESAVRDAFEEAHRARFGYVVADRALVVEAATVEVIAASNVLAADIELAVADRDFGPEVTGAAPMFTGGRWHDATLTRRDRLEPGARVEGPALVTEELATTVVEPGWVARVTDARDLVLERIGTRHARRADARVPDPMLLELFNNRFMNIAEQMGARLRNTAHSVNIKERLDFSCALFDPDGNLVANAPHMPVHLGSMSESVKAVVERNRGRIEPGDVFALNDPYHGGTHLPDITVITPVFGAAGRPIRFFVGSRGHHADIGGVTPGSMPPFSTRIDEEGVEIDNLKLVSRGRLRHAELLARLRSGRYPARDPLQNLADLEAQIAANEAGRHELERLVDEFGLDVVQGYMGYAQDNGEEAVRRAIAELRDGSFVLPLDNGAQIAVSVRVDAARRRAVIDFTGTSSQLVGNFNAPRAVCTAAVIYVFRTLVDDDIPLNAGCLRPLELVIPPGSMLDPAPPASVVAGNVETSMAITNALYGALGVMASGPSTMNNFTFGNARYQYYETIASGSGAGPGFDGTAVVQTHMTNSRLTDPEVLETRFPVRVEQFAIRPGSGGAGAHRGGDGGVRSIRFLAPMTASILSNGRVRGAFGLAGGSDGLPGVNRVERADGRVEVLGHLASVEMQPGDAFVIETPGGGGYGSPPV